MSVSRADATLETAKKEEFAARLTTIAGQKLEKLSLKEAGLVRRLGLSNVNRAELDIALDLLGGPSDSGIVSVQMNSLISGRAMRSTAGPAKTACVQAT